MVTPTFKNLEENKKINTIVKSSLLQTRKAGKAGSKSGKNKGKKAAAEGSKAKSKKNPKKKADKKGAKKNSDNSKDMEASKEKDKNDPCKLVTQESVKFCHPSSLGSCRCGTSLDSTVSSIPRSADWPVSFPLQSAVQYVLAMGLHPETIVSRLSLKLGGRQAHSEDSYRKIGASEGHIDIIRKGYRPTWDKHAPRQRVAPLNPTISTKGSNVLDTEVTGQLEKGAIHEVGPVQGQYVSLYLAVPK